MAKLLVYINDTTTGREQQFPGIDAVLYDKDYIKLIRDGHEDVVYAPSRVLLLHVVPE